MTVTIFQKPAVRLGCLLLLWALTIALFRLPLGKLLNLSLHDDRYSHVLAIPAISLLLVYLRKSRSFSSPQYCATFGMPLFLMGALFYFIVDQKAVGLGAEAALTCSVAATVVMWIAGFICCYGIHCFRVALFPLLFLLLVIPIPAGWLEQAVVFLQRESAAASAILFKVMGVPVMRQGVRLSLPGVDIEVAEQCSSIRSSISLLITSILASHLFLSSRWGKSCVIVLTIPIAILKNAVRIVTISWLSIYVNRDFLTGSLHHKGGILFALLGFGIVLVLLLALQRLELLISSKLRVMSTN